MKKQLALLMVMILVPVFISDSLGSFASLERISVVQPSEEPINRTLWLL